MKSVLFELGPIHIYGYGLMIALGVLCAFVLTGKLAKSRGLSSDEMFNIGIIGLVAGLVGAKVLYWLTELPNIIKDPSLMLNIGEGFVVYGGLVVGIAFPYFYTRKKGLKLLPYLDCAVIGIALGQSFGRVGCFLAGCCYGVQTSAWFGVTFPEGSLAPAGVSLVPTQLISSAGDLLLAFALWLIWRRNVKPGFTVGMYLVLYSIGRFVVEFFRNDERGSIGILSTSQFIALFTFAIGMVIVFMSHRRRTYGEGEKSKN